MMCVRFRSWIAVAVLAALNVAMAASLPTGKGQAAVEQRIALVIGNSDYNVGPLPNPVADAVLMANTLRGLGFEVMLETDANQKRMKRAIQRFGERLEAAGREGVGLFFYAGHGLQTSGLNYLIPINAAIKREADIEIESVSANWVLTQMEYARSRLNFVILDACRNNPYARGFRSYTRGLAQMDAPKGTLIAYSTAPGKVAADGTGANSPYTDALARIMVRPNVKVEEIFKQVRVSVLSATRDQQVPWEASSLVGDFYFAGKPQPASTETAVVQPAGPSPATDQTAVEVAFWKSVEASENPADFEAYLRKYGSTGAFTVLARNRLDTLRSQSAPAARSKAQTAHSGAEDQFTAEDFVKAKNMMREVAESADFLTGSRELSLPEKARKFRGLLGHVVDFGPMARFVLGEYRDVMTPEQWEDFFLIYRELFLTHYEFSSLNTWTGEYSIENVRPYGKDTLVTVAFQDIGGDANQVHFRVRRKPGSFFGFVIVDVIYEGVSLVVTQKGEFGSVLKASGVAGLIRTLEEKFGEVEKPVEIPD